MIELLLIPAGALAGFALGMVPGAHVNNWVAISALAFAGTPLALFVISASVAFVFASFFPTILLSAPSADTALAVLPGRRFALAGGAGSALSMMSASALAAFAFSALFMIPLAIFVPSLLLSLKPFVPFVLIAILVWLSVRSRFAPLIVLSSSALGFLTFDYNSLLPLLSGFFGMSTLVVSFTEEPRGNEEPAVTSGFGIIRASFLACFLSAFFSSLPAVPASVAATTAKAFKITDSAWLAFTASASAAYMSFSFAFLSVAESSRSGSAALLAQGGAPPLFFMAGVILISAAIACTLAIAVAPEIAAAYSRADKRVLRFSAIGAIVIANAVLGGSFGLLVLFASTSVGVLAALLGACRTTCMAALIAPTIAVLL